MRKINAIGEWPAPIHSMLEHSLQLQGRHHESLGCLEKVQSIFLREMTAAVSLFQNHFKLQSLL